MHCFVVFTSSLVQKAAVLQIVSVPPDQDFLIKKYSHNFFDQLWSSIFFLRIPRLFLLVQLIVVCVFCFLLFPPPLSLGKDLWVLCIVATSSFSCLACNWNTKMEVPLPVDFLIKWVYLFQLWAASAPLLELCSFGAWEHLPLHPGFEDGGVASLHGFPLPTLTHSTFMGTKCKGATGVLHINLQQFLGGEFLGRSAALHPWENDRRPYSSSRLPSFIDPRNMTHHPTGSNLCWVQ